MIIVVYELKNDSASMRKMGWISTAIGNYIDAKYDVGTFNFSVPATKENIELIAKNRILYIDDFYWGTVEGFKFEDSTRKTLSVTGKQLTSWMGRRVIIPPTTFETGKPMGFEVASGSTETIIKYAVQNHLVNPEDITRKIYGLTIAKDLKRGKSDDAYIYRYVQLDTAVFAVGKAAKLGAKITGHPNKCEFVFDVIPQINRTANQNNKKPLILEVVRGNLESSIYTYDESASYNTFFCIRSDDLEEWEQFVQTYRLDNKENTGYLRRETSLNISVDSDSENIYSEFEAMSRKEMEAYRSTENMQAVMSRQMQYRKDYSLGDIATVRIYGTNIQSDMEIIAVETKVTETNTICIATFGEEKISKFKIIERRL